MPGFVVHTLLAARVLDRWPDGPGQTPAGRHAFLCGCVGPDAGVLPGGEPFVSDLAHYVRAGELARALLRTAETDAERAYAWGWATHVLADATVHPVVNQGAGERVGAGRPLAFAADPVGHVVVELGLEGIFLPAWAAAGLRTFRQRMGPECVRHLARAYAAVYGPAVTPAMLGRCRRAVNRWGALGLAVVRAWAEPWSVRGLAYRAGRVLSAPLGRGSVVWAVFRPLPPTPALAAAADRAVAAFPDRFLALARGGLADLPDYNLDTGEVEGDPPAYPLTAKVRARLRAAG